MQRRGFQHVDQASWNAMLRKAVDDRVPLDEFLRGLLTSVWWNQSQRAQQRFFLDRGGDSGAIARDLGRIYFGKDLQCAQCHNHPQIDDYLQVDYHGLLAFVSGSSLQEVTTKDDKGVDQKVQIYVEKAAADAPFESVFDKGIFFRTASRLPGRPEIFEDYLPPDRRYRATPNDNSLPGVPNAPLTSRRELLASDLKTNRAFAENWANRIWALMMGRGLVHPLDMHHSDNPPSNPKLLATLSDALVNSNFDVRFLMAEIAKSQCYQRGTHLSLEKLADPTVREHEAGLLEQTQAQVRNAITSIKEKIEQANLSEEAAASRFEEAQEQWRGIQKERTVVRAELDAADVALSDAIKKVAEANTALQTAVAAHEQSQKQVDSLNEAIAKLESTVQLIPNNSELQTAMASVKSQVAPLQSDLMAKLDAKTAATKNQELAVAARDAEQSKWQSVVDKLKPIEARLHDSDKSFVNARELHDSALEELRHFERSSYRLELVASWLETLEQIDALKRSEAELNQQVAASTAARAGFASELEKAQEQKKIHESSLTLLDAKLAEQRSVLDAIQEEVTRLSSAKKPFITLQF